MENENTALDYSKALALNIIIVYKYLCNKKKEYVLSKQLLRSGTSIGANVREAECAQSHADFLAKMFIALKEANETLYWLELLHESHYIDDRQFDLIYQDAKRVFAIIMSITKTTKERYFPQK